MWEVCTLAHIDLYVCGCQMQTLLWNGKAKNPKLGSNVIPVKVGGVYIHMSEHR